MKILIPTLIAAIGTIICIAFCKDDGLKINLITDLLGLMLLLISGLFIWLYDNRHDLKLWVAAFSPFYSKPEIRLSIAYLFQIEHHGKYLLVRNNRDQSHAFQPVGGVYKYYPNEARAEFQRFGILPDDNMPIDEGSNADLRVQLKHRKCLPRFLKWFGKMQDREADPWREFFEELISPGILPARAFPHIQYSKIGTHRTGIQHSQKFKMDEFLLADVFVLLPTPAQTEKLQDLQSAGHPDIIWASKDEILLGRQGNNPILPHAKKLFEYQISNHNS